MSATERWTQWRDRRMQAVTRPFGIASLDRTVWLDEAWQVIDGVEGRWRREGDAVRVEGVPGVERLSAGAEAAVGDVHVRGFAREDGVGVRVLDPASEHRTSIQQIEVYDYDPAWALRGRLRPAERDVFVDVTAVDGVVTRSRLAGVIELETPVGAAELTVTRGADGALSAVLGDATNGSETYRFRFLEIGPQEGDEVPIDFNRAFLPPCAFSPEYVCPLPLPTNRWAIPVRAGEKTVARDIPPITRGTSS